MGERKRGMDRDRRTSGRGRVGGFREDDDGWKDVKRVEGGGGDKGQGITNESSLLFSQLSSQCHEQCCVQGQELWVRYCKWAISPTFLLFQKTHSVGMVNEHT